MTKIYRAWRLNIFCLTAFTLAVALHAPPSFAATAATQSFHDCGNGLAVRLSAPDASQGGLLLVDLRSDGAIADVKAEWGDHTIPFWADPKTPNMQHALLGIDLEKPAGKYNLAINAQTQMGRTATCGAAISVRAGKFAIEKLTVAEKFVEPDAEQVARADQERQQLREIFATETPERLWHGQFQMPLKDAKSAHNFGRRRVLNGHPGSPHTGEDFPAPAGTPVHAAQRGRVVLAENLFFSGNTVVIDHGLGVYTFYGHLESISVTAGDIVATGALLGKVGATGRVTGPHLHWGLTVDAARVNPLQIVALR